MDEHRGELTAELKRTRNKISKSSVSTTFLDDNFMIHVLSHSTEEQDVVVDGTKGRLMQKENNPNKLATPAPSGSQEFCWSTLTADPRP